MHPPFFSVRRFLYFFLVVCIFSFSIYMSFPYSKISPELEKSIRSIILDANRLSVFIFGTTVTANVYLYNMKNKISSSSHTFSDQIMLLYFSVFINIFLIFSSFIISNIGTTYNLTLQPESLLLWIKIHYSLFVISLITYLLTLIKFVNIFNTNRNVKKHSNDIKKEFYINNPLRLLFFEKDSFNSEVQSMIERHIIQFYRKNPFPFANFMFLYILRHSIYKYFINFVILITALFSNKFTEESSLSYRRYKKLRISIEIYAQQLEFLIGQNSKESIDSYFEDWNSIISEVYLHLFHANYPNDFFNTIHEKSNFAVTLYKDTLSHHARLIISTSKNYEHSEVQNKLIESFLNALPYRLEKSTMDLETYQQNISFYKNTYFEELLKLIVDSIKQDKIAILHRILRMSEEEDENLFTQSKSMNIQSDYEDLWISVLMKIVEINKGEHLSLITTLLINSNTDYQFETRKQIFPIRFAKSKDDFTIKPAIPTESIESENISISTKTIEGFYLAIIKANELEFYKAAGYLTKILASHLDFQSILNSTEEIKENYSAGPGAQIKHKTNLITLYYNNRSFQYCFAKSFVLIYCQYVFKDKLTLSDFSFNHNFLKYLPDLIINPNEFWYFLQKIENKQKEYNMISLIDANSDSIKSQALQSFYKNGQQLSLF